MAPLFAESAEAWLQVLGYIAAVLGTGGLLKLWDRWDKRKDRNRAAEEKAHEQARKDKAEDDATTLRHYDDLFKRMKAEQVEDKQEYGREREANRQAMQELQQENAELRRRVGRTEVRLGRAEERIRHLEAILKQNNLQYPVWMDESPIEPQGPPVAPPGDPP